MYAALFSRICFFSSASLSIYNQNIRREIRSLTDDDREAYFDAMEIFYTIPTSEGKALYGGKFNNYERIVAYHDSRVSEQGSRPLCLRCT